MTSIIKITAVAALLVLLLAKANVQAAETTVLTLSCDGTGTSDNKPEPITKMGLVVNLADHTVSGFLGVVARIDKIDTASISFGGEGRISFPGERGDGTSVTVFGSIDRVTGTVSAMTTTNATTTYTYDLLCKPVKRLF